jgi:hypothetical protein
MYLFSVIRSGTISSCKANRENQPFVKKKFETLLQSALANLIYFRHVFIP